MLSLISFLEEQGYTSFKSSPDSGKPSKLWDTMGVVLGDDPERAIKGLAFVARSVVSSLYVFTEESDLMGM